MGGTAPHSAAPRGGSTACAAAGCFDGGNVTLGVFAAPLTLRSTESCYRAIYAVDGLLLVEAMLYWGSSGGLPQTPSTRACGAARTL